jgi:hypothetical protein
MSAELDPIFIAEFFNELDEQWVLIDENENQHIVVFNQILTMPYITFCWESLGIYYEINDYGLISFTYLGESKFHIHVFHGPIQTNEFPRYHSQTTSITRNPTFVVFMPNIDEFGTKLVSIHNCLIFFLQYNQFHFFLLADLTK